MANGTWKLNPQSALWTDPDNWQNGTVPTDSAEFQVSTGTSLSFDAGASATIDDIVIGPGSRPFAFNITQLDAEPALTIKGQGVVNQTLAVQSFVVASFGTYRMPQLKFAGAASAGDDTVVYYAGPTSLQDSFGGGTIGFYETSSAGSARFTVRTGAVSPHEDTTNRPAKQVPPGAVKTYESTLGGSVVFNDNATAGTGVFSLFGTLGDDGDTFGNVVFHDTTTAACGTFLNYGGTVPGGDGGNTQFYDRSDAATGVYINYGGTAYKHQQWGGANGGDVAFDGVATGGLAWFQNFPASIAGAHGGVTSFNNNPNFPPIDNPGATAGQGTYINYGANDQFPGGGGHTELTAVYGFSTAGQGTFVNFGGTQTTASSAGHTIFAIKPPNNAYKPSADQGVFWNHPGISAGYTEFLSYGSGTSDQQPDAANGVFHNLGSHMADQAGGYTIFKNQSHGGTATLIAYGGVGAGQGGRIIFQDTTTGGGAHVSLIGNGTLDLSGHAGDLTIGTLSLLQGTLSLTLRPSAPCLTVSDALDLQSGPVTLALQLPKGASPEPGVSYPVLHAPNLGAVDPAVFKVTTDDHAQPHVDIKDKMLFVTFA
ncbi:MAG: hypothetical protein AAGF36_00620 [Pseudomonadota bacterium]